MTELFAGGHLRFVNGAWRDDSGDPVDIAEVVRCKDCKHYNGHRYCGYLAEAVLDNDFCSYGERIQYDGLL